MKLQRKTAIVFVTLLIGLMIICSLFISSITLASYSSLEQQYLTKDLSQAVNKLHDEEKTLSAFVSDWGPWDDSYNFVLGKKPEFVEVNLLPDTYKNLNMNLIIITNRTGGILYSGTWDGASDTVLPVPEFIVSSLDLNNPLLNMTDPRTATTGILVLPDHPMIVASRPIVHTDFSGQPEGVVIMGRYLDDTEIRRLSELTQPSLTLTRITDPSLPQDLAAGGTSFRLMEPRRDNRIQGYAIIPDIYGVDALVLGISEPRDIYAQGLNTAYTFILIILGSGLMFGLVVMLILNKTVLSRMSALSLNVHSIGIDRAMDKRVDIGGDDEFSELAVQINLMLDTLEETRQGLLASETRFRELSELLPQIVFEMDTAGILLYVNKAGADQFGISEEKIALGVNIREYISPENSEQMQRGLAAVIAGGKSPGETYTLKRPDGSIMKALVSTSLIHRNGRIAGFRGVVVDLTERMELREKLAESTKLLSGILQASPVGVFRLDPEGAVLFVNATFTEITEIPFESIRGKYWADILRPDDRERLLRELSDAIRARKMAGSETRFVLADGSEKWLFGQTVPLIDPAGTLNGWVGTITDITERKKTEDALRESGEYLETLLASVQVGILVIDATTHTVIDANPAALAAVGVSRDEIQGRVCHKFFCPAEVGSCPVTDLGRSVDNTERVLINARGEPVPIIKYVIPVMLHGRRCLLETFIDNSYRKKIEAELKESEEKYRALTENTGDILFSTDMTGNVTYVSPQVNRYGYLVDEVIGRPLHKLVHPEDFDLVEASLSREFEKGAQFISTFRILDKWGNNHWFEEKSSLRLDQSGNPLGIYGILRDVSDRKRAEDAIELANKKLNLMNNITRHDILNTITGVYGYLDMAKATASPAERVQLMEDIRDLVKIIQRQINFTKEYQEVGVHLPRWQNVNDVIGRAVSSFEKSGIHFAISIEDVEIYADPLLEKVFYNLVDNAIRYGQTITSITLSLAISDKGLSLSFEDNGVGIDSPEKRRIFERGVGKNTGMGLFLTREILGITQITIEENGVPGKGARFEIRVPKGTWRFFNE
jgi:PAS domain S-box-containing protein